MDIKELYSQHKTLAVVIGGITVGAIVWKLTHKSSSTTTANASTYDPGNSAQYLVPYTGFLTPSSVGGPAPDGGSTGAAGLPVQSNGISATTGTPSSAIPINNLGVSGTANHPPVTQIPAIPGYTRVTSPAEGSALSSAGRTIYVLPSGKAPSQSNLVPWTTGYHPPPNSTQFVLGAA